MVHINPKHIRFAWCRTIKKNKQEHAIFAPQSYDYFRSCEQSAVEIPASKWCQFEFNQHYLGKTSLKTPIFFDNSARRASQGPTLQECSAFSFDFFFLKPSQKRQSEVSKKTSYSLGIHPAQPINEILPDIFNSVNLINLRSVTVLLCKHVSEFTGQ